MSSKTLTGTVILSGRYTKKPPDGFEDFSQHCPMTVIGTGVHGKFLYWLLEDERSIWNTLGLTGEWSEEPTKHSRIAFHLDDGVIFYNDTRNFGTLKFVQGKLPLIKKLNSLGPDLLAAACPDDIFIEKFRKKDHKTVVEAMMDQKVVAGIGNYIKADSLWLAKISPHRTVSSLSDDDLSRLNSCIQKIMQTSFKMGGATIYTYKNFDGSLGEYGERFLVYNRREDPEGNPIIKETTRDKRTTHWSPEIQV